MGRGAALALCYGEADALLHIAGATCQLLLQKWAAAAGSNGRKPNAFTSTSEA